MSQKQPTSYSVNVAGPTFIGFRSSQNITYPGDNSSFVLYSNSAILAKGTGLVAVLDAGSKAGGGNGVVHEWVMIPQQPIAIPLKGYGDNSGIFVQITSSNPAARGAARDNYVAHQPHEGCTYRAENGYATNDLRFFNGDAQWM